MIEYEENLRNSLTTKLINIKWLQDEGAIILKKLELGQSFVQKKKKKTRIRLDL